MASRTVTGRPICPAFTKGGVPCKAPATASGYCNAHTATAGERSVQRTAMVAMVDNVATGPSFAARVDARRSRDSMAALLDPRLEVATLVTLLDDLQAAAAHAGDPLPLQGAILATARELSKTRVAAATILTKSENMVPRERHVSVARSLAQTATKSLDLQRRDAMVRLRRVLQPDGNGQTQSVQWSDVVSALADAWSVGIGAYQREITEFAASESIIDAVGGPARTG